MFKTIQIILFSVGVSLWMGSVAVLVNLAMQVCYAGWPI